MQKTTPHIEHRDRGFTLIEIIVAMVLLVIAVGLVGSGIIGALRSSTGARAGSVSDAAISRAISAFSTDVATAETLDRAEGQVRDPFDLADGVRTGDPITRTDPASSSTLPVDINDIQRAEPTQFSVWSDVDHSLDNGVECVTWQAKSSGENFQVVRRAGASCGSGDEQVLFSAPTAAAASLNTQPFTYVLQCNPGVCGGTAKPKNGACGTWESASVTGTQLRWIVGVRANFSSVSQQGQSAATTSGSTIATIRSRATLDYTAALGC